MLFLVSRNLGDLWIHACPYVRPSFLRNLRIRFFWFLIKLWLQNCKKVTVLLFGRKFKIGPFLVKIGPKLSIFGQNSPKSVFFAHIFKLTHQIFLIFLMRPWLYKCKKWQFCFFVGNSKLALFWPKTTKIWPFLTKKLHFFQVLT